MATESPADRRGEMLKDDLARLMRWRARALVLVAALLLLACVEHVLGRLGFEGSLVAGLLGAVSWIVTLPTGALWLITLCFAFRTGKAAFGMGSAIGYLLIAGALFCWPGLFLFLRMVHLEVPPTFGVVLLLWPGLFVIPHMIRLDIQREYDIGDDNDELTEPELIQPAQPSATPGEVSTGIQSLHRNRGDL